MNAFCVGCGFVTENPSRLCDTCIAERARTERTTQGFSETITDPTVLDRVATILRPSADAA